ncbi:MAG: permease, partial [Hyphomicrobium sp.]
MTRPQTLTWFARHELNLAWRDWAAMMAGGKTTRERAVTVVVLAFVAGLHWLAHTLLSPVFKHGVVIEPATLVILTASLLTTFSMMLSQAIEHVTRAFYARADLDLILSSPAPARHLFAIRIIAIAATGAAMTSLLAAPFINTAAAIDGPRWLAAYAIIAAMSALSTGLSLAASMFLFRTLGPKRTRVVAQIIAAIVGAALLIAIQAAAVLAYGNFSRLAVLQSSSFVAMAPGIDSLVWLPAKALLGAWQMAVVMLIAAAAFLAATIAIYAPRFAAHAVAAAGVGEDHDTSTRRARASTQASDDLVAANRAKKNPAALFDELN